MIIINFNPIEGDFEKDMMGEENIQKFLND